MNALARRVLISRARQYIDQYKPVVIGVAGSYGATLTKHAIARALGNKHNVRVVPQSRGDITEVPASILGIHSVKNRSWLRLLVGSKVREIMEDPEPDVLVVELPVARPGDLDWITGHLPFSVGVITNTASSNLDVFGSREMVAHELMSVAVAAQQTVILEADDPLIRQVRDHVSARTVLFGELGNVPVRLVRAQRTGSKGFAVEVSVNGKSYEGMIPYIAARHQLQSILAAISVAYAMECDIQDAFNVVRLTRPPAGHMRIFDGLHASTILDDTYDATFEDTLLALKTLQGIGGRRRIVVLGDLRNMGGNSARLYTRLGQQVSMYTDVFIAVGGDIRHAAEEALRQGGVDVHHFMSAEDAGKWISDVLRGEDNILVKGARKMNMESVVCRLLADPGKDQSALVSV